MSKIIEHFLLPLFIIMSMIYVVNSFCTDIELTKVFHHTTNNTFHIEAGALSLYFSNDPHIQNLKTITSNDSQITMHKFFFPHTIVATNFCKEMIQHTNKYQGAYKIELTTVTKPSKGILLTLSFDPKKFSLNCEQFDSINLQKGLVFRLYNKELLNQLEQKNNQPILRTLWHKSTPCIAIDSGHGGYDKGTTGIGGISEKEICLSIGTIVTDMLKKNGYTVVATRNDDSTVLLDNRTKHINNNNADLCVSIHANFAQNSKTLGIETFCLQSNLFKQCFSNLSTEHDSLINDITNKKTKYSYKLAQCIQRELCNKVRSYHQSPIDRKVKFSVSQILLGCQAPSVLVEVGFLSHNKEAILLNSKYYQKEVSSGIVNGIKAFLSS